MLLGFLDAFAPAYMQRALVEIALLAVLGGVLGSWIVLRRLAFFTHGAGAAAVPGLVVAGPWGLAPQVAALASSLAVAAGVQRLARLPRLGIDAATALGLVAALAGGSVLASDVYRADASVDRLLAGSLLALSPLDVWLTAGVCVAVLALEAICRRGWLARAFDPETARATGMRVDALDRIQLVAVVAAVIVALDAVGALLVGAFLIVPAATARLVTTSLRSLRTVATGLALAEGVVALLLARELDAGPGAAMAVTGGAVFAVVALGRSLAR